MEKIHVNYNNSVPYSVNWWYAVLHIQYTYIVGKYQIYCTNFRNR